MGNIFPTDQQVVVMYSDWWCGVVECRIWVGQPDDGSNGDGTGGGDECAGGVVHLARRSPAEGGDSGLGGMGHGVVHGQMYINLLPLVEGILEALRPASSLVQQQQSRPELSAPPPHPPHLILIIWTILCLIILLLLWILFGIESITYWVDLAVGKSTGRLMALLPHSRKLQIHPQTGHPHSLSCGTGGWYVDL
ncbi:hypothetical protein Tco_0281310 [Tanacetum coccineum]